jgi:hypothetical protein
MLERGSARNRFRQSRLYSAIGTRRLLFSRKARSPQFISIDLPQRHTAVSSGG